ncbi:MAG TPA: type II secretion system protein [Candidatus Rubrimentiphilum sp.]|nr:type II secretion system protein [Candidatus Rubrimentiphilum sp.]
MEAQRGTSLIEVLLTVAILAMLWTLASMSFGNRAFETQSAATIFDAQLAHARTIASAADGSATLSFAVGPGGNGTVVSLSPGGGPPETLRADVSEASLGKPPFAISVDAYGHAVAPEPCPAAGGYTLTFSAGAASESRLLPCPATIAGSPEPVGTVPP